MSSLPHGGITVTPEARPEAVSPTPPHSGCAAIRRVYAHSAAYGADRAILVCIAFHDGPGGSWPSLATIARETGYSTRYVRTALRRLEAAGELRVQTGAGGTATTPEHIRTNRYLVTVGLDQGTAPARPTDPADPAPAPALDPAPPASTDPSTAPAPRVEAPAPVRARLDQGGRCGARAATVPAPGPAPVAPGRGPGAALPGRHGLDDQGLPVVPPPYCAAHPGGTDAPCRACGEARQKHGRAEAARRRAVEDRDRSEARARRAAEAAGAVPPPAGWGRRVRSITRGDPRPGRHDDAMMAS